MSTETFDTIKIWAKLINQKPNFECTHFFLSDDEKVMIIDLHHLEKMPSVIKKLADKEKAYLFINLDNDREVRYYAYDVCPSSWAFKDEIDGKLLFTTLEKEILQYLENNAEELTLYSNPMTKIVELCSDKFDKKKTSYTPSSVHSNETGSRSFIPPYGEQIGPYDWQNRSNSYVPPVNNSFNSFKERDAFQETLYLLVKNGKTASAVDHIKDFVEKKKSDKEVINLVFRSLSTDKMDLISLREILSSTEEIKADIPDRESLVNKLKVMVAKIKPKNANVLLEEV